MFLPLILVITMAVPFLLADAFNNATQFNESFGKWISAINRLLSYTPLAKYLKGYKRDKLIEITNSYRNLMRDLKPEVVKDLDKHFRKKFPNLFPSQMDENDSRTEVRDPFPKDEKKINFYNQGSIDNLNSNNSDIQFELPKKSFFKTCWRGLGKCYQKIPSLGTCWKGMKTGFNFLFSSCCKRSKEREMEIYTDDDDDFEKERLIN